MSFHFQFVCKQADAVALMAKETMPAPVKVFMEQAVSAFKPEDVIMVKAIGHLYNNDFQRSNAEMLVELVPFRSLPAPATDCATD